MPGQIPKKYRAKIGGPNHLLRWAKNTKSHSVTFSDTIHLFNIYLACSVSLVLPPDVPALIGRKFSRLSENIKLDPCFYARWRNGD